jgi:integrase
MRNHGTGSLFQHKGCERWVIQYYKDGKREREATGLTSKKAAQAILNDRLNAIAKGEYVAPRKPARVEELYAYLRDHMKVNNSPRGLADVEGRWRNHLEPAFGSSLAVNVTPETLTRYAALRQEAGAANATINREFAVLRRMFTLAKRSGRVRDVPYFPMLKENNVRKGFVEGAAFDKLASEAQEPWLRVFLELAYTYGWRRGEILGLRVRQLNFTTRTIRLDAGTTKNGEGREVTMTSRVFELLRAVTEGLGAEDSVLMRTKKNGKLSPVREFRHAWENMCARAGLTGLLVHDMRRSAAKALRAAGVPESVIMATGGWRTPSMLRRYAIVSSADQKAVVELLERARAAEATVRAKAEEQGANGPKTALISNQEAASSKGVKVQ